MGQLPEDRIEEAIDEVYQAGFEMTVPPVDIMVDFWVNKIVKMQASLTSRAIISLLFDKYKFLDVLEHFKKVFFCERGDLASDLTEEVYSEESVMNKFSLNNMNTLFKSFENDKLPDVKFKLSLKREETIDSYLTVLTPVGFSNKLSEIFTVKFLNQSPIFHLISDNVVNKYFVVFSILIQVRQQRKVLSLLWKTLRSERSTKNLPEDYLRKLILMRSIADDTLASYESFVCQFCIEMAWKSLQRALLSANSFNRIFKVHLRYLTSIIESASLGGTRTTNFNNLQIVLNLVSQLNSLVKKL